MNAGEANTAAVVAAAGIGRRMGKRMPKQLLELGGKPILLRTLETLERMPEIGCVVVAAGQNILHDVAKAVDSWGLTKVVNIVEGGAQRQDTVWRGLAAVPEYAEIVMVHDAVRPFVSASKIRETIEAAAEHGAAILAVRPRSTIKRGAGDRIEATLDRDGLWEVQTPQAFRRDILMAAYAKAMAEGFYATDDAALVERTGIEVAVVEGEERNIKITTPLDLRIAAAILEEEG
jgi:2-C-methyl-D-erythritol 4-phosphate cytidylyltransferase